MQGWRSGNRINWKANIVVAVRFVRGRRWAGGKRSIVTGPLGSGWNTVRKRLCSNDLVPFLVPEKEDLVLFDRPANVIAVVVYTELVLHAVGSRAVVGLHLRIKRVQLVVAARIESTAVKGVRATLGDDADLPTRGEAELRPKAVAFDLEFLDGIQGRIYQDGALRPGVVVVGAVHQPLVAVRRTAADGYVGSAL